MVDQANEIADKTATAHETGRMLLGFMGDGAIIGGAGGAAILEIQTILGWLIAGIIAVATGYAAVYRAQYWRAKRDAARLNKDSGE